ncbi:MAG: GNAT family N-acetyltransferase [Dehalococcoidia bacterium]
MNGVSDDLRAIVHTSLLTPSPISRYRGGQVRRALHGDVSLIADGGIGPDFNNVLVLGPARPENVFALAEEFFGGAGGYSVVVEVETAQPVEAALQGRGWTMDEEEPALVLPHLPAEIPPPPAGLTIRWVTDESGFGDFQAVSTTAYVPSLAAATDADVALFVGSVDGKPTATSRLVRLGSIAEISSVVTEPEYRRRGFGAALTWAAIAEGVRRGCATAMLTATELGYPVYVRMGFLPVCTYRTYLPPSGAGSEFRVPGSE